MTRILTAFDSAHLAAIAGSVDVSTALFGAGKERNMGDSERSEAFGTASETDMSSDDAAELEQLRREAAMLREQLDHAVGPH
ncbi:hypothetical protein, partial [Mycobacterium sp. IS-2888]|uniref:hypothetical protein n=1 Tax=Mycobacterium sp. IS-2888 TaxID=1834159 RepID=UPI001115905D